jgi:hypothetical protein
MEIIFTNLITKKMGLRHSWNAPAGYREAQFEHYCISETNKDIPVRRTLYSAAKLGDFKYQKWTSLLKECSLNYTSSSSL